MTAIVRVKISGLCMFVPDSEHGIVQVLMPTTHGHEGHPSHHAAIVYDTAHERQASTTPSECYRRIDVDGCRIVVNAAPKTELDDALDERQLMRLGRSECFDGVDPAYKGDKDVGEKLNARVALRSGYATYCHISRDGARLYCTDDDGQHDPAQYTIARPCRTGEAASGEATSLVPQHMAFAVRWRVGKFATPLRLGDLVSVFPLNGGRDAAASTPSFVDAERLLHPVGGKIDIRLMHVVETELPNADGDMHDPSGDGTAHFTTYYDLAKRPGGKPRPVPTPVDFHSVGATCAVVQARFPE